MHHFILGAEPVLYHKPENGGNSAGKCSRGRGGHNWELIWGPEVAQLVCTGRLGLSSGFLTLGSG